MYYKQRYLTKPEFDDIELISDGVNLTHLYFINDKSYESLKKYYSININEIEEKELVVFELTKKWLDNYFNLERPAFFPPVKLENLTPFRKRVIDIMKEIPYGNTISYGDIAKEIAVEMNINRMSAQAVGSAVGFNPICIIIPCHRVVGKHGDLTGYASGMKNKIALLKLEGNDMDNFFFKGKKYDKM